MIHAAWYAEPRQYLQSPKNQECLSGTLRLAEGADRQECGASWASVHASNTISVQAD